MAAKDLFLTGTRPRRGGVRETAAEELRQRRAELLDAIARRAYELFEQRGGEHGYHVEDWLQAERELVRPMAWVLMEEADGLRLIAEVPGFSSDQVKLHVSSNLLLLEAHATESWLAGLGHPQIGRDVIQFIPLPEGLAVSRATLEVEHGILQVQLPSAKRPPQSTAEAKPAGRHRAAVKETDKAPEKTTRKRSPAKGKTGTKEAKE